MIVLERQELRMLQASASVVPPTTTASVAVGLAVPMPSFPPVGARITLPCLPEEPVPVPPAPGCIVIEPPSPPCVPPDENVSPVPGATWIKPPEPAVPATTLGILPPLPATIRI